MTSEKRLQKFYTDEVSSTVYLDLGSASDLLDLGSASSFRGKTSVGVAKFRLVS